MFGGVQKAVIAALIFSTTGLEAQKAETKPAYDKEINEIMLDVEALFEQKQLRDERKKRAIAQGLQIVQDDFDDVFPPTPISRPLVPTGSSPYPGFIPSHGAAYLIAIEVLYQTLEYYGVKHYFAKDGNSVVFKVISSEEGYFNGLDSAGVAFALREFSRYISSHACNNPSMDNFNKMFSMVAIEDIGLRFKFDMAWTLQGNYLEKEANSIYKVGRRWGALSQVAAGQRTLGAEETQSLSRYLSIATDAMNFLQFMNSENCFVDISVKPREEIIKRVTLNKFLNLERSIFERYSENKKIIDAMEKAQEEDRAKVSRTGP